MPFDINAFYGIEDDTEEEKRNQERKTIFNAEVSKNLEDSLSESLGLNIPLAPDVTQEQNQASVEQREKEIGRQKIQDIAGAQKEAGLDIPEELFGKGEVEPFRDLTEGEIIRLNQSDLSNFANRVARGVPELTIDLVKDYFTVSDYMQDLQSFEPVGTHQLGRQMNEKVISQFDVMLDEALPTKDPQAFYSALGSGIGSGLFFMGGGMAARGLGLSASLMSSVLGAGTMSQQMFEEAIQGGATEEEAFINFLGGAGLGATEGLLGVGRILDKIGKRTGQSFFRQVSTGQIEETFQESVQNLGQNFTAQETFDLSRSLTEGLGTSAAVAWITGGLFTAGAIAIQRLTSDPNTPQEDRDLLEKARENFEKVNKKNTAVDDNKKPPAPPSAGIEEGKVKLTPVGDTQIDQKTGQQNEQFFTEKSEAPSSNIVYQPVIENVDMETPVGKDYQQFSAEGNFTGHISKMIPSFAEKQKQVAEAITKSNANTFLDIGTSEGGMIKTVSNNSNIKSVGIDPNSQMKENFEKTPPVKGAEFKQEAFQSSFKAEDGTVVNEFQPDGKFDIVNEDFAFQFINNDRQKQVEGVKELMTPEGVFVTSQKFHTENSSTNERKKLEHQKKYFNESQLTSDKQGIVNGMADDMVSDIEYVKILKDNFKYVEEFWNAGDFKGYLASDNQANLQQMKGNIGDLSNEFSDDQKQTKVEQLQQKQKAIPQERQLDLFHFSDNQSNEMVTEPKMFGDNSYTRGDQKVSPEPRTFFYTNPQQVQKDSPALQSKRMFITTVDAGKVYDLAKNEQGYGKDENGTVSIDKMIVDAKSNGWEGVRYPQGDQETVNMFTEQYAVRPEDNTSLADVISGKWSNTVAEAQKKLNQFGSQFYDITSILNPALGISFVSNMAIVVADRLAHKNFGIQKGKIGTVAGFTRTLLDEYENDFPIVRRYARDIFEKVQEIKNRLADNPLSMEQSEEVMNVIKHKMSKGELDEFIVSGEGIIIIGGDILDFEGGRRRHIGLGYPEDQATRARYRKEVKITERTKDGVKYIEFKHPDGSIKTHVDGQGRLSVSISNVTDEMQGTGLGGVLYEEVIKYAQKNNFKTMTSDGGVSEKAVNVWEGLKQKGYKITQAPSHKIGLNQINPSVTVADNVGDPVYELDVRSTIGKRFADDSYSVWATDLGVARMIEKAANQGNDTLVFMAYPNAWNAIFSNYEFQKQLHDVLATELGEENVPKLTTKENWEGRGSRVGVHPSSTQTEATWLQYEKDIKKAIAQVKKKKNLEGDKTWTADAIAMKYAIDNGINLKGKLVGVAKFKNVNRKRSVTQADKGDVRLKDERLNKHNLYDTEIEGFNYVSLEQPIDYKAVEDDISAEVGLEGDIPLIEDEARKDKVRRTQIFRIIQQRGLPLSREQASIVNGLIDLASGNDSALNKWIADHPDFVGEIPDPIAHSEWMKTNKIKSEKFRNEADKELTKFLAPMSSGGLLNPDVWKGLSVVGKAIARSSKTFGKWSVQMIKSLGDWVRPILRSLWSQVTQTPAHIFKRATKKEINHATDPSGQIQMMGKSPEQAEAERKASLNADHRVGTLPSRTSGYNMGKEHPRLQEVLTPTVEAVRNEFDLRRRGTIDNDELMKRAQRRAEKLTDRDILELNRGDIKNAEDVLAMRIYLTDQMLKVSDEIRTNAETTDGILIKNMSDELTRVMRMWQGVRALGTEAGRVVQSFNIPMDDSVIEGMRDMAGLMNQLDPEGRYGGDVVENMIKQVISDKKSGKPQSKWMKAWEVARFGFLNWILQNPLTDIANIHGNVTNLSFHIAANIGNLGGAKTLARGIKMGVKEGARDAMQVLHGEREAISKFTEGSQVQLPTAKGRKGQNYAKLFVPTTRLGMEDAFFRGLARNIETERMVVKTSMKLGVNPDEVSNAVSDIINNPELESYTRKDYVELVKYLEKIEDQLVFQQELGRFGKAMAGASRVVFPIIPFVTTPANLLKAGIGATPLGLIKLGKADLGSEEKNQIIRKAVAGSVFMSGIAALIGQGIIEITGGGSDDEYERDLMEKMGYKPNHVYINTPFGKFGGGYMNINPINTMFTVAGDLYDKYRFRKFDKPDEDKAWHDKAIEDMTTVLLGIGTSISEQSFLQGVKGFMDFLSGRRPDWALRMFTNFARVGSIQGVQRIAGTEDRGRYETKGEALSQLQKNFPLASNEGLTESVSSFGEQRQSQYERFPIPVSEVPESPQHQFLIDKGLRVKQPSDNTKLETRSMNDVELEFFRKGVGQLMDKVVLKLYESQQPKEGKEIEELNEEELQDKLDKAYESAKDFVKKQLKKKIIKQIQLQEERNQ